MHAEHVVHLTNRSIFLMHIPPMAQYRWEVWFFLSPQTSLDFPTLVLSPLSPPSTQPDGLPLTEHWHQMCSSSVDSGTSWVECASGSVNENGYAVCVRVCLYLLWFSGMWQLGNSLWVRVFFRVSHSEMQCRSTQACSAQQLTHQGWNYTATHPELTNSSLFFLFFISVELSVTTSIFPHT